MDLLSLLRTLGGLGMVLGLLAGALWAVRRFDIRLPGRVGGAATRRLDLVERLAIDAKRSVALIRRDSCEHLLLIEPGGAVVIETGIGRIAPPPVVGSSEQAPVARPVSYAPAPVSPDPIAPAAIADDVPFHEALSRIQEKARRMRVSAAGAPSTSEVPHA